MLYWQHILTISLLQLPGVDPNDPSVKDLLASLQGQSEVCLYEPSVLVHNVPTKRGGGSLGIVTEHNFESEPLLSFPRYHNDDKDPLGLGGINTLAPAKNITRADVYYDRRNGYCKGLLLKYANGAQRAVGQCRIGIDPFKAYEEPSWFCYHDLLR